MSTSRTPISFADHFRFLKYDIPASVVVFLVALPLCLGVAHASGVPPLAGVVSGLVGGVVIGLLSGSHKAVSGPAAGLIVVVLGAVDSLGYPGLLLATFLAGALQLVLGVARFGGISTLFPRSVVRGMLVAIGLILILKQIPHAIGHVAGFEDDQALWQADGQSTFTALPFELGHFHVGALLIAIAGLASILVKERVSWLQRLRWIPGPLLAVAAGVGLNELFLAAAPSLAVGRSLLVQMPTDGIGAIRQELGFPDFTMVGRAAVWSVAITLAIIASIETLLSIEALDSIDPDKRVTPTNRELVAQGAGNLIASLLGGISITAVIVRGSTNVAAGARTRASTIGHGLLLLASVLALAPLMNRIPLAALAAVLLHVGYELANPRVFASMFRRSTSHFAPFISTVLLVLSTDLLTGVFGGFAVAVAFIVVEAVRVRRAAAARSEVQVRILPTVPWISKLALRRSLARVDQGGVVVFDGSKTDVIHADFRREIEAFIERARERRIEVRLHHLPDSDAVAAH